MKKLEKLLTILLSVAFIGISTNAFAQDADSRAALTQQTVEALKASAKTKPTAEMIIAKVNEACKLLEAEGPAAYPKFKGKDSKFIFAGTYIWVHDLKAVIQMHPVKYKLEGKSLLGLKDKQGKLLFLEMNKLVQKQGSGWVSYLWPKPGEKAPSRKVSYVKLCKMSNGQEVVVGCGIYDMPDDEIEALVAGK